MKLIIAVCGVALVALSSAAFAQDNLPDPGNDSARQARMNDAYRSHNASRGNRVGRDLHSAGHSIDDGLHKTGRAIEHGAKATGHAISRGAHATGRAISRGAHATGRGVHHGVDKVTGHP